MSSTQETYIADGFSDDIDELMHQCLKKAPVTYAVFSEIFRSMQMSSIFTDRQLGAEVAELSEEVITVAKCYMVANTDNFEESVIGLFLVYALVELQPYSDFAHLRILEEDVMYIDRIEQVARRDKRFDVLYVLAKLLTVNARYHAVDRDRGMEISYRKYLEGSLVINFGQRPKGVFLRQNEELDIIKELDGLQIEYDKAKVECGVDLNYTNNKFAKELNSSLNDIISGLIHKNEEKKFEAEDEKGNVNTFARSIKERAMKLKVDPMRHLIGVGERSPVKRQSRSTKSDIKTISGKIKSCSPKKRTTRNSTKSRKRKLIESSDSESLESSDFLSDNDSETELDIDLFQKAPKKDTEIDIDLFQKAPENDTEINEVEIDNNQINLTELPSLVSSEENGRTYEIEIVDNLEENEEITETNHDEIETNKNKKQRIEITNNDITVKKEKRDLKKTLMKSRFRRMGIEPIANFDK